VRHGDFPHKEQVQRVQQNGHNGPLIASKIKLNNYLSGLSRKLPSQPTFLEAVSPYLDPQQRQYGVNRDLPIESSQVEELSDLIKN